MVLFKLSAQQGKECSVEQGGRLFQIVTRLLNILLFMISMQYVLKFDHLNIYPNNFNDNLVDFCPNLASMLSRLRAGMLDLAIK